VKSALHRKWRFARTVIEGAPNTRGVYVLWDGHAPLGVGHALGGDDTIQSRLRKHLEHAEAAGVPLATHYSWEMCRLPLLREQELVSELGLRQRSGAACRGADDSGESIQA